MQGKEPLELKSTINLPKTSFSMKANLQQNEPKWLAAWENDNLYGQIREARKDAPIFTLHDGPPYANGRIHLGTAINKMLKDFIVKMKTLEGFNTPYRPGWDCHGLPIEINVDKELGGRKSQMSPVSVRRACRKFAEKFVDIQRQDFMRLGVLGEWDNPYLTMDFEYEASIAEAFLTFLGQGYVYRGRKAVYWCISCKTALAEAEVEYENDRSPSIYVRYPVTSDPAAINPALAGRKLWVMIWTTTPWTLPASMAVAFHPDFEYAVVGDDNPNGDAYIIESRRLGPVVQATGLNASKILARVPAKSLEKIEVRHPFLDRAIVPVMADYVTAEDGTGIVHTAPGHGREDNMTGVAYGLDIYCPVDEGGTIFEGLPEYVGKRVFDANAPIIELLKARGVLMGPAGTLDHSYPHCWRCHNPIIFRAAEQWFINLDHRELRQRALDEIKKTRWVPSWGEDRISNMIAERPDWCISRQRIWGVPLTVFHCVDCRKPIMDAEIVRPAVELFRKEGADAWYSHPDSDLLTPGAKCPDCGGTNFRKETDILDVWFDSGSSHYAVLGHRPDLPWPSDVYLEAGDQYRGWFHSSLLVAIGTNGAAPYRQVLTHGWVLDAQGRAMHKSLGNVIEPQEVIKTHGAEILRLWAASVEFGEDVSISPDMLTRLSEAYRKLRNTFRYCLGNLYDFDPSKDMVAASQLEEIDNWALVRTAELLERAQAAYGEYAFHKVYRGVYDFATVDMSKFYFDILKDRLYTSPAGSVRRRAAQTTLYRIADAVVRVLAPLMCFTADEVWTHLPAPQLREKSVHLARYISPADLRSGLSEKHMARMENWPRLIALREEVLKALDVAREEKVIGGALEARVILIFADDDGAESLPSGENTDTNQPVGLETLVEEYRPFLPGFFIVSQVEITSESVDGATPTALAGLSVKIEKALGQKCDRCWNYSVHVGEDARYSTVCERCSAALKEIEKSIVS